MTNWTTLVANLGKAEKDVSEWEAGLTDAKRTLETARGEMLSALGSKGGVGDGSKHRAAHAPVVKVARRRRVQHDYKRKTRVLALLKDKGGFLTPGDVASAERIPVSTATHVLATLHSAGKLNRVARGRYAAPEAR